MRNRNEVSAIVRDTAERNGRMQLHAWVHPRRRQSQVSGDRVDHSNERTLTQVVYSCNDVDECQFEYDPVCSQACNNTVGSFTCSCMKGYVLRPDGRTCKAVGDPPTLLFANRVDIRQVRLDYSERTDALIKSMRLPTGEP